MTCTDGRPASRVPPVPALVIDGLWFEDKRLSGRNWTIAVGLSNSHGRTWKDAFKMRRHHLVERRAEPVHRQNDTIKVGNSEEQQPGSSSTSAPTQTRCRRY